MMTIDWHFYLENLENKSNILFYLDQYVNNTYISKFEDIQNNFKEAFHLLYKEMMLNPVIFNKSFMNDNSTQWQRLMDIGRYAEINFNFSKDFENYLREYMIRINNQLTFYFDSMETMNGFNSDAKDRMQHEFDVIFEEEINIHMDNLYEIALDIFSESYIKMY